MKYIKVSAYIALLLLCIYLCAFGTFAYAGWITSEKYVWGTDECLMSGKLFNFASGHYPYWRPLTTTFWPVLRTAKYLSSSRIPLDDERYQYLKTAELALGVDRAGYVGMMDGSEVGSKYRIWIFDSPKKEHVRGVDVYSIGSAKVFPIRAPN